MTLTFSVLLQVSVLELTKLVEIELVCFCQVDHFDLLVGL